MESPQLIVLRKIGRLRPFAEDMLDNISFTLSKSSELGGTASNVTESGVLVVGEVDLDPRHEFGTGELP